MKDNKLLITFKSTHSALKFEKIIKDNNLYTRMVPVPRQISTSCGIAGRIKEEEIKEIINICQEYELDFHNIYRVYIDKSREPDIIVTGENEKE